MNKQLKTNSPPNTSIQFLLKLIKNLDAAPVALKTLPKKSN